MEDIWSIDIKRVEGGYILDRFEGEELIQSVVGEPDTETGSLEAMRDVLNLVADYFGMGGSKHDKHRIKIEIEEQET